jgi:hypothetical protein
MAAGLVRRRRRPELRISWLNGWSVTEARVFGATQRPIPASGSSTPAHRPGRRRRSHAAGAAWHVKSGSGSVKVFDHAKLDSFTQAQLDLHPVTRSRVKKYRPRTQIGWRGDGPSRASDRMLCHSANANQVRLFLHTAALLLMHGVRVAGARQGLLVATRHRSDTSN